MRVRLPPYLVLLLAACAGTEVGNPTFACGGSDDAADNRGDGGSGAGGVGPSEDPCSADGSDCGLSVTVGSFLADEAICPGGRGRTDLLLVNLTDAPLSGAVEVSDDATVAVTPDRFALPPHDQAVLAVIFSPAADASSGTGEATLRIVLDGVPVREIVVHVEARIDAAAPAALSVLCGNDAPCGLLDLGEVDVGATGTATFFVVNDGCEPLGLLVPDVGTDGRLALVDPPAFPATLAPRDLLELRAAFTPATIGRTGGEVTLSTPDGVLAVLPWQGIGR